MKVDPRLFLATGALSTCAGLLELGSLYRGDVVWRLLLGAAWLATGLMWLLRYWRSL